MTGLAFVDTNILVYARDAAAGQKQARAMEWLTELWRTKAGRVSYQVLQEYYVTVIQKLRPGLAKAEARKALALSLPGIHLAWTRMLFAGVVQCSPEPPSSNSC